MTDLNGRFVGESWATEIKGLGALCEACEYVAFGERVGSADSKRENSDRAGQVKLDCDAKLKNLTSKRFVMFDVKCLSVFRARPVAQSPQQSPDNHPPGLGFCSTLVPG